MSEYGFQAFPEMKTIATFAAPEDYELESDVMNAHQKASIGNFLIKKTMGLYYTVPEKFEDLVYKGLVLQGQGMRHGMRRTAEIVLTVWVRCIGSLTTAGR